jgi:hypothetical protein
MLGQSFLVIKFSNERLGRHELNLTAESRTLLCRLILRSS